MSLGVGVLECSAQGLGLRNRVQCKWVFTGGLLRLMGAVTQRTR